MLLFLDLRLLMHEGLSNVIIDPGVFSYGHPDRCDQTPRLRRQMSRGSAKAWCPNRPVLKLTMTPEGQGDSVPLPVSLGPRHTHETGFSINGKLKCSTRARRVHDWNVCTPNSRKRSPKVCRKASSCATRSGDPVSVHLARGVFSYTTCVSRFNPGGGRFKMLFGGATVP